MSAREAGGTGGRPRMAGGHAILLAGGQGRRLATEDGSAKAFVSILGRPLLSWSLETFANDPAIETIVVVHAPGRTAHERCRTQILAPLGLEDRVLLADGGERRQDSSRRGLEALPEEVRRDPESLVLIHDAARPLVTTFLIHRCLRELAEHPDAAGALPALPVRETLKQVEGATIRGTVPREGLWAAQTPQVFRLGPLLQAHEHAAKQGRGVTDDAALLEASGAVLRVVPGDLENIKVTYPEDRVLVERLLRDRETR
ncbi:MAG: 2-C-methyl-D-erythritol 4-phosphate cytidylyltransferase [Candidatus Eisenbacteria bacterium]